MNLNDPKLGLYKEVKVIQNQGKGVGQDLLAFALRLAVEFSQRAGLYAVAVGARHDKAKAFYVRPGFISCVDGPLCLYLPVATLEQPVIT